MNEVFAFLNTPAGQALAGAVGLCLLPVAAWVGKHLGITPAQAKEVLSVAREAKAAGKVLSESELAKEAQRRIRESLRKVANK